VATAGGGAEAGDRGDRDGERRDRPLGPRIAWSLGLILLLTAAVYSISLGAPFYLDDHRNIVQNPLIRDLKWFAHPSTIADSSATDFHLHAFKTRYLGFLSFALSYRLTGLDPAGFRLVSVLLHLWTVVFVAAAVRRLFALPSLARSQLAASRDSVALVVGALFALHPIQTQAVDYVVQRVALLAAAFSVTAFWSYLRMIESTGRAAKIRWLVICAMCLAAAALSKQNAIVFPFVLAVFDLLFVEHGRRVRRIVWTAFAATAAIVPLLQLCLVAASKGTSGLLWQATEIGGALSRREYFLTEWRVIVDYLRLLVAPIGLTLEHDVAVSRSLLEPGVLLAGMLLAALLGAGVWLALQRRLDPAWRLVGFGTIWFFLCLAVESSLIPIPDLMFEHRVYLPSVGFFLAAVVALTARGPEESRRFRLRLLAAVAILLAVPTAFRNSLWADERAFWYDALAKSPNKVRVVYNVGFLELRDHQPERARQLFERVLELDSGYVPALSHLARLAEARRDAAAAVGYYERAISSQPDNWRIVVDLRSLRLRQGDFEAAARLWSRAVGLAGGEDLVRRSLREVDADWALPENVAERSDLH